MRKSFRASNHQFLRLTTRCNSFREKLPVEVSLIWFFFASPFFSLVFTLASGQKSYKHTQTIVNIFQRFFFFVPYFSTIISLFHYLSSVGPWRTPKVALESNWCCELKNRREPEKNYRHLQTGLDIYLWLELLAKWSKSNTPTELYTGKWTQMRSLGVSASRNTKVL